MAKSKKVEAECGECAASGVYRGFAEPKGVGVVCVRCGGTGKRVIEYIPFTVRKRRKGIRTVRLSQGAFIGTGVGPIGTSVSYAKFLAGKLPQPSP